MAVFFKKDKINLSYRYSFETREKNLNIDILLEEKKFWHELLF